MKLKKLMNKAERGERTRKLQIAITNIEQAVLWGKDVINGNNLNLLKTKKDV